MASMTYCRHQNAAMDFGSIVQDWNEGVLDLSAEEVEARRKILSSAIDLVAAAQKAGIISADLSRDLLPGVETVHLPELEEEF